MVGSCGDCPFCHVEGESEDTPAWCWLTKKTIEYKQTPEGHGTLPDECPLWSGGVNVSKAIYRKEELFTIQPMKDRSTPLGMRFYGPNPILFDYPTSIISDAYKGAKIKVETT